MRRTILAGVLFCMQIPFALAEGMVVSPSAENVHHLLDGAGRKNLALQGNRIAVVWEDDRRGVPQAMIGLKTKTGFSTSPLGTPNTESYSPVVTEVGEHFLAGWTEAGRIRLRLVTANSLGAVAELPAIPQSDRQTLTALDEGRAIAAWTGVKGEGARPRIHVAIAEIHGRELKFSEGGAAISERFAHPSDPALCSTRDGAVLAWHDRTSGTNTLYVSRISGKGEIAEPLQVSDIVRKSDTYGKGSSAIRSSIACDGNNVLVAWLDKRADRAGYKVYAAISSDGGKAWSENMKVQDEFGDETPQWHPSAAFAQGKACVTFDDTREGNSDIFASCLSGGGWSDNIPVPAASGPGEQRQASVAIDPSGRLHLAWIAVGAANATSVRYALLPDIEAGE